MEEPLFLTLDALSYLFFQLERLARSKQLKLTPEILQDMKEELAEHLMTAEDCAILAYNIEVPDPHFVNPGLGVLADPLFEEIKQQEAELRKIYEARQEELLQETLEHMRLRAQMKAGNAGL
jgi:hypothetical protein